MAGEENGIMVEAPVVSAEEIGAFLDDTPIVEETPKEEPKPEGDVKVDNDKKEEPSATTETAVRPEGGETVKGTVEGSTATVTTEIPATGTESQSELEMLKAQNAKLTELLEHMAGTKPASEAPKQEVQSTEIAQSVEINSLLESVDFDKIMENKADFIEFMKKALGMVREEAVQRTLTNIPQVVGTFVQRQTSLRDVATQFYTAHPELKRVKQYVTHVANQVSAEHPDWTIVQVLEETAKGVKEALQLKAEVDVTAKTEATKPTLPGGTKTSKIPSTPSSGLQKEIDDLIND